MGFVMPEIAIQRVVQQGIDNLRQNPTAFDDIFSQFLTDELKAAYGQDYIDQIKTWFFENTIPVVQSWSYNVNRIPCFSVHLSTDAEDEGKAAVGDHFDNGAEGTITTGVFTTYIDIGIRSNRNSDQTLWLYYILAYILFKEKRTAEKLGMQLQTWSASDYQKDATYQSENIWTRWVRVRCTTQNFLQQENFNPVDDLEITVTPERVEDIDE
jgi:hypothetical protein